MAIGNPALLQYFLQDDLYLLNEDKVFYAESLMQPEEETPAVNFNCLGSNKKAFIILVHYARHEHMDPAHLKALESTLNRKTLTLDDVAIVNVAKYPDAVFNELTDFFNAQKILILGQDALLKNIPQPQLNTVSNSGIPQLFSYSFEEMLAEREKVRVFWEQMKNF